LQSGLSPACNFQVPQRRRQSRSIRTDRQRAVSGPTDIHSAGNYTWRQTPQRASGVHVSCSTGPLNPNWVGAGGTQSVSSSWMLRRQLVRLQGHRDLRRPTGFGSRARDQRARPVVIRSAEHSAFRGAPSERGARHGISATAFEIKFFHPAAFENSGKQVNAAESGSGGRSCSTSHIDAAVGTSPLGCAQDPRCDCSGPQTLESRGRYQ